MPACGAPRRRRLQVGSGIGSQEPDGLASPVRTAGMRPRLGREIATASTSQPRRCGISGRTAAGISLHFPSARRQAARDGRDGRDGRGRRVTADAVGRPFVQVTGDARGRVGMGGDPRGDAVRPGKSPALSADGQSRRPRRVSCRISHSWPTWSSTHSRRTDRVGAGNSSVGAELRVRGGSPAWPR